MNNRSQENLANRGGSPAHSFARREHKRGTMLVVVLGLLVALFIIGTSFSYVTLSERRAAANYIDRQRALDLALDGVEYSIARLRVEATRKHYDAMVDGTAGKDPNEGDYNAHLYSLRPLDSANPSVSWGKNSSTTAQGVSDVPDGNWVDYDGNGIRGPLETRSGNDKIPANLRKGALGFAQGVTGFHADGINAGQIPNSDVRFLDGQPFGPSGTYEELGDYFRVRVIDSASLLNLNNFNGDRLKRVLVVLGGAIDSWLNNGKPKGKDNPIPNAAFAQEIVQLSENLGGVISSKDQLRPIWRSLNDGDRLYELAMNFITVNSWVDLNYRDYTESNLGTSPQTEKGNQDKSRNPLELTEMELWRSGYSQGTANGRDGWPDWQPEASRNGMAPININLAPFPVLVAMFADMEAKSRLLYFRREDDITVENRFIKDKQGQTVPQQINGTTDLGRQNSMAHQAATGIQNEDRWYPAGSKSQAIFQLVPIGPITTTLGESITASESGGVDYASALAREVMTMRAQHPFTSWQDFDSRFCRELLLGISSKTDRSNINVPDLVGVFRGDLSRPGDVAGVFPKALLPEPKTVEHPASPYKDPNNAMSQQDFAAWYWKSVVDMIRAALCPANLSHRYNADYPYHVNVDRMDLTVSTSPICFSSNGVYEVISQGEILSPKMGDTGTATNAGDLTRTPAARRRVRTVVSIYDIMTHSNQRDFMEPLDPSHFNRNATSSSGNKVSTLVAHTKKQTKSGPFSIDELSNGSWESNTGDENTAMARAEDSRALGYKQGAPGPALSDADTRDRWKGHNKYSAASGDTGWVTLNPQDKTFMVQTAGLTPFLNFHARFNEGLRARNAVGSTDPEASNMLGLNANSTADADWGHLPLEYEAMFDDFISSATPRSQRQPLKAGGAANEFENAATGEEATRYSSLLPDGLRLSGQGLRPASGTIKGQGDLRLKGTYNNRGLARLPRLKLLRYPNGSNASDNPFAPVRPGNYDASTINGINDSLQTGYVSPIGGVQDVNAARLRLTGSAPPWRGTDNHNTAAQGYRQSNANMPYYQGTVDFWIKWDLSPQGSERLAKVPALGEVDPASHNFSGLFGATAYGRFVDHQTFITPTATNRDSQADFEGVQFFVFKEPGGYLRFTRLLFSEAFGAAVSGTTSSVPQTVNQFGIGMRRIFDQTNPWGGYTGTNDICTEIGGSSNLGFLFARTDAWVNLNTAQYVNVNSALLVLRPHDWHRFTLSYNSNTNQPYHLWIDGRKVQPVEFYEDPDGLLGVRNDGAHAPGRDQPIPPDDASQTTYNFYRATNKLLEINPEDRLTVGCVFRRQLDLKIDTVYTTYFENLDDPGDVNKRPRPVFMFDSNFVAVANATIDDFRISATPIPPGTNEISSSAVSAASRYVRAVDQYFEHGFFPVRGSDGQLHAQPVRLGSISWIELRPDYDPYAARGLNLHESSRISMEWGVFRDYATILPGGRAHDFSTAEKTGTSGDMNGRDPGSVGYWAEGGISLENALLPSGQQVGLLLYRAHFEVGDKLVVNNVTPYLLQVRVTVLTPPRKLSFVIDY